MNATLNKAATVYLNARNYSNIQSVDFYPFNFLAEIDGETVLISASIESDSFGEISIDRNEAERALIEATFEGLVDVGMRVRFDTLSIIVVDEGKALVRHHINCLE